MPQDYCTKTSREIRHLGYAQKPLSPEIIQAIVKKYHYYIIGFDLPEDIALLSCLLWLGATNMPALVKAGLAFSGLTG
jgi:hypothetical protein